MNKKHDLIIYAAATLAFVAVPYVDWHLGNALGCSLFQTPDANITFDAASYAGFWACLSADGGAGIGRFISLHTFGFDLIFPPLLALAASLLLFRIANRLPRFARLPVAARWLTVTLLPVFYLVADYAENLAVLNWLKSGDSAVPALIPAMTAAKFAALGVTVVLAIALKLARLQH
jgi:hypothetical protein